MLEVYSTEPEKVFGKPTRDHVANLDFKSPLYTAPKTHLESSGQVTGEFITLVSNKHVTSPFESKLNFFFF